MQTLQIPNVVYKALSHMLAMMRVSWNLGCLQQLDEGGPKDSVTWPRLLRSEGERPD